MITHQQQGSFRFRRILLSFVAVVALGVHESSATPWYLSLDGASPERAEPGLPGWTVVLDIAAQAQLPINPTNRVPCAPVFSWSIRKAIDSLSPLLLKSCASGEVHRRLVLASAPTNGVQYRITLDTVRIGAIRHQSTTNSSAAGLEETVQIQFASGNIEMARLEMDADGGVTDGLTAVFDPLTGEGELKPRLPFRATITREAGRDGVVVRWPAEKGHRYRILSRATLEAPWRSVLIFSSLEDGTASQFVATSTPTLFLRVEEVD